MRCLDCQYNIRGLQGRVCPECGRGFDPADARTFDDGLSPPRSFWRNALWAVLGSSMPLCLAAVLAVSRVVESAGYDGALWTQSVRVVVWLFIVGIVIGATVALGCVVNALMLVGHRGLLLGVVCVLLWVGGMIVMML